jgi:hypothetical protein
MVNLIAELLQVNVAMTCRSYDVIGYRVCHEWASCEGEGSTLEHFPVQVCGRNSVNLTDQMCRAMENSVKKHKTRADILNMALAQIGGPFRG